VDTTLDDIQLPEELRHPQLGHDQTQHVRPLDDAALRNHSSPPQVRGSMPSMDDPSFASEEPEPLPPETPEMKRRRARSRTVFLFVACFLVGVIGAAAFAYRMGYVGSSAVETSSLASYQQRAEKALRDQHWDTPAGSNVRDLTNEGLAKYPRDRRLLEIRAQATDELVKDAVTEKYLTHFDQAARLAQLAHELDPTDVAAERLAAEYGQTPLAQADAGAAHDVQPQLVHTAGGGGTAALVTGTHGTIELTPAKPHVNVPVTITVHITVGTGAPKGLPEGEVLGITGPDVPPGTMIPILADGPSTVRGAVMFNEPGKFDLTFTAKVDGNALKLTRSVIIDPPGGATNNNSASDGGKWL
jgi:hypothetical protein